MRKVIAFIKYIKCFREVKHIDLTNPCDKN